MTACLDSAVLEQLRTLAGESGAPLLAELLRMFVAQTPPRLLRMTAALADGDTALLEHEAHNLRGNAGALGALLLHETCGALEDAARCKDTAALAGCFEAVSLSAAQTLLALEQEAQQLSAAL